MNKIIFFALFLIGFNAIGQNKIEKLKAETLAEGKRLYASEMASWYGTDIFMEKYKDHSNIGGYFSYSDNDGSKCIFFSKGENAKVLGTITFDETFNVKNAKADYSERDFSAIESQLCIIRQKALSAINSDTIFKRYKNTNFNLVPMISDGEKKVYVLTGPTDNGIVIFGNDYLLKFSNSNELKSTKRLHANIIRIQYGEKDKKAIAAIHSHLPETGDIITATDICTTMLYEKFTGWETNYVMSKNYVSIWNCMTDELEVVTREEFDKKNKD